MSALRAAWARLTALFRRDALDRDFDEEAQAHIALAVDDYLASGISRTEAERLARLRFGSVAASKDAHRDARGLPWLEGWLLDLRLSVRGLLRDWTFTAPAVAMLALALALNATVFTVMDAMLHRGFPHVQRNDRLVYLQERARPGECCLSYADFEDWRARATSFEGLAFVGGQAIAFRDSEGRSLDTRAITVGANLFPLLGVRPILGREFSAADEIPGAPRVALLTHRFWESRFTARPDIVGTVVHVNGEPATIIGVMPPRFEFPMAASGDLWMPISRSPALLARGLSAGAFTAVGRLRDDVTREEAQAELQAINRALEATYPETNRGLVPTAIDYAEFVSGSDARLIWGSLWIGACLVLLIACANVANLTLVRTIGRWREFATRLALGAGQGRMIRLLLIETATVVAIAAIAAWGIAAWSIAHWESVTHSRYQVVDYAMDGRTLAYFVAVAVLAALLLAIAPIARVMQLGAGGALKGDARGVTRGLRARQLAAGLVAAQMTLAMVLLSGAGVLVRSFVAIVGADCGLPDPSHVVVGLLRLPSDRYPAPADRLAFSDRLETSLREHTGIEAVAMASVKPIRGVNSRRFEIDGQPPLPEGDDSTQVIAVAPNYFRALGLSTATGRAFAYSDRAGSPPVVIVNSRFAERHWPAQSPLGRRIRLTTGNGAGEWRTVVGVVPNIMQGDALRQQFKPLIYVPLHQDGPARAFYLLARTTGAAAQQMPAIRAAVQALDADVSLEELMTLEASLGFERDWMDAQHSELGKYATVAPVVAAIALLLAATGLVAVIAHSVGQRTKEIGIRMAIGAMARDIGRMVVREGLRPVVLGLVIGLAASLAVNRLLQSQLVGVGPYDPMTMIGAPLLLIVVALIACRLPARRAMRVDPVVALRHE
ncbi:MAG: ABC transporter permease [Burkholderiales bacterium]|nr:ABC transporter permease [Burkholderiales bacterium]